MNELNMKAVLRQTGLTSDTLRAWEKRYGAVQPRRSSSGRRVYSDAEVQRLRYLSELVRLGHSIGTIASLADERLVSLLRQSKGAIEARRDPEWGNDHQSNLDALFRAVDAFDLGAVRSALARIRYLASPRAFALELAPQVMHLIGKRVQDGTFSISHEHALSEILHTQIRQIYEALESSEGTRLPARSLVFATREGDPHDFGLMMSAIVCRYRGYKTYYLGRNLPVRSLAEATSKIAPSAVVLGLAALHSNEEKIGPAEYLKAVDRAIDGSIEIWVGGSAASKVRKPSDRRDFWVFDGLADLEAKLSARNP